ncbi:MAG: GNAT family N-acetyltransferase [Kiritimatiellia bacterium]
MSPDLEIVSAGKRAELEDFLDLPFRLYRGNPNWVPPLRSSRMRTLKGKTAFFEHGEMKLFLAVRGGQPVGRIAAIKNDAHNRRYSDRTGFFGFFECDTEDAEAAVELFRRAERWLKEKGMDTARGPVNPSMNSECGLLIQGFDHPPMVLMPYNPPGYEVFFENAGYGKCRDLYAYLVKAEALMPESSLHRRLQKIADGLKRRHPEISVRPLDMKNYTADIINVMNVFEEARKSNWGYVPVARREVLETASDLKRVVDPEIVLLAEVNGEQAGVSLALPNVNRGLLKARGRLFPAGYLRFRREMKKNREVRIFGIAALPKYRHMGIAALLTLETVKRGSARGYNRGEASWVLEDNDLSNRTITHALDPDHYKTYRIYDKKLA